MMDTATPHPEDQGDYAPDASARGILLWEQENRRGLSFAGAAAWTDAADAFAAAADELSRDEHHDPASHPALALVLGNLAQACFRSGRSAEAIRHAQRACALRVALLGEDAVAVARVRSDLAVMLAASGRIDEAPALIARAIAGIEQSVGDEDLRLAVVLENAARVALASGNHAASEPHLLRLHALLGAHDLPTDRAEQLLERVFVARGAFITPEPTQPEPESTQPEPQATQPVLASVPNDAGESEAAAEPSVAEVTTAFHEQREEEEVAEKHEAPGDDEWEDQPLRDAVIITDALLRTTPGGSKAIQAEASAVDPFADATDDIPSAEAFDAAAVEHDIFGDTELELTDLPGTMGSTAKSTASDPGGAPGQEAPSAGAGAGSGLGFVVQYGVPRDTASHRALTDPSVDSHDLHTGGTVARGGADASSEPTAEATVAEATVADATSADATIADASAAAMHVEAAERVDVLTPPVGMPSLDFESAFESILTADNVAEQRTPADVTAVIADSRTTEPPPGMPERRHTPRPMSVVMPSPASSASVRNRDGSDDNAEAQENMTGASRLTVHTLDALPAERNKPSRAPRVAHEATSRGGRGALIGGTIAALAAAAGWFFLRG